MDRDASLTEREGSDPEAAASSSIKTSPATDERDATGSKSDNAVESLLYLPRRALTRSEVIVGVLAIVFWIVIAAIGVAVPTKTFFDDLVNQGRNISFLRLIQALFVIMSCYTFTNIAALCCLSAIIGAVGRSARIDEVMRNNPATDLQTLCTSAIIRGFFLYLVVVSGTLFVSDQESFDNISVQQYLKLSGLVSLLSFAIGYEPRIFELVFSRVVKATGISETEAQRH